MSLYVLFFILNAISVEPRTWREFPEAETNGTPLRDNFGLGFIDSYTSTERQFLEAPLSNLATVGEEQLVNCTLYRFEACVPWSISATS